MTTTKISARASVPAEEISAALNDLGIKLSATEIKALSTGKTVSLERRPLSEFGNLLVNADKRSQRDGKRALTYHNTTAQPTPRSGALDPPSTQPSPGGNPDPEPVPCRGTKLLSFKQRKCGVYVHWPPAISVCCQF